MNFIILAIIVFITALSGRNASTLDKQLNRIVSHDAFSIARWEVSNITQELSGQSQNTGDARTVLRYFDLTREERDLESRLVWLTENSAQSDQFQIEIEQLNQQISEIEGEVERVLEMQIGRILREQGIYSPFPNLNFSFPPLNFKITKPPYVLVISPLDEIESIKEILLQPDLSLQERENIENQADELGVSSLVIGIGGLGATYPTFVANDMDLQSTINTAVEEWLHQYLAFRPLGFRYVLDLIGVVPDYDVALMNETLAGIASREIGAIVYDRYYAELINDSGQSPPETNPGSETPAFDFNAEMREIRKQVDLYLARGQVDEAEEYMNEKREHLAEHGYYIRKLNQAYFAFYGTYADSPTSIDPIGTKMIKLRKDSPSLKIFLDNISGMTSRQELDKAAGP